MTFSASDFRVIGPDGLTVGSLDTLAAYSCLDPAAQFTSEPLGRAQQYAGQVVIDSPTPTGVLVYLPINSENGWEWEF